MNAKYANQKLNRLLRVYSRDSRLIVLIREISFLSGEVYANRTFTSARLAR
jgi:hypothetical protein